MELRVIKYFLAVADLGNISVAAKSLHISQPTISRQIQDLEEELGVTLFSRGNRQVALTDDGLIFKQHAKEIMDLVTKTENTFALHTDIVSGDIFIGAGETYAMKTIADIAKSIQSDHCKIRFHLYSGNADDVKDRIDKGLLDFGILVDPTPINSSKYHVLQMAEKDTWGILVKQTDPLAKHDLIHPADLINRSLIISSQKLVQQSLAKWMKQTPGHVRIAATYNLLYNAALLVDAGVGIAFTLDHIIDQYQDNSIFKFVPLAPAISLNINIIWKKDQIFSPAAQLFVKKLSAHTLGMHDLN